MLETAVTEAPKEIADSEEGVWIEALPARIYHTPQYGEVPVPLDKLQRMITNFHQGVRGQDIATDYEHGIDPTKGLQASGWYEDFDLRPSSDDPQQMSLYAKVKFTDDAKKDIKDGKYKYWSLEWDDEYLTDSGHTVPDVVIGGGLTNRPIAKRTMPINFSEEMWDELDDETKREFAVLTSKQRNALPKSAFLYVEKDGTTHLPYRNASGGIDLPHLRNAISRLSQKATGTVGGSSWLTDSLRASLLAKARRLLAGASKASEIADHADVDDATKSWLYDQFSVVLSESAAWEHSDPGVVAPLYGTANNQPDPGTGIFVARQTGSVADDDLAVAGGWRRDPLPNTANIPGDEPQTRQPSGRELETGVIVPNPGSIPQPVHDFSEGGNYMPQLSEQEMTELSGLLGVEDIEADGVFMPAVRTAFSELKTLKESVGASSQEREFAEQYPTYWREHQDLLATNRANAATAFAESVGRIKKAEGSGDDVKFVPTRSGLSALALEQIANVHKKFSEGTATMEDFEETIKTITNGGIVEFGEVGSSVEPEVAEVDTSTAQGIANARKLFAEKVAEEQAKDKDLTFEAAVKLTSEKYPDIADAYRATAA